MSGLRNTAYTQFYIEQLPQLNTTRTALLRTNTSFDYDAPGKIDEHVFHTSYCLYHAILNIYS